MSPKHKHDREYDVVVFGATGYTGLYTAEYITAALPTDLNWAIAGRSQEKLEKVANDLKSLNPDRRHPAIEVCNLDDASLASLARKTFILITTVGPYCRYGEPAFKACAENGTHYLDVTGELPWVWEMIKKYEGAARGSGALMFPEIGIESTPSDLVVWSLALALREELGAQMRDATLSIHRVKGSPSGGTMASVMAVLDRYPLRQLRRSLEPFALSPVSNAHPPFKRPSLFTKLTGLKRVPILGLLTTSFAGRINVGYVERTWGLLSTIPSRKDQFYGPNFTYQEYMRTSSSLLGIAMHVGIAVAGLFLALPPVRWALKRFVVQPGQGPSRQDGEKEELELRAIANPDLEGSVKQAYVRSHFHGSFYLLTGIFLAQGAMTIFEDFESLGLEGGIYTPACLGQRFIDRLDGAGFKIDKRIITA